MPKQMITALVLAWLMTTATIAQPIANDPVALTNRAVEAMVQEDFAAASRTLNNPARNPYTTQQLAEIWKDLKKQAGAFRKQLTVRTEKTAQGDIVTATCAFERTNIDFKFMFDTQGQLVKVAIVRS